MRKKFLWLILVLVTTSVPAFAADSLPSENLPSPYFVDEVHCSGINVPDVSEGWLLSKDEVEPARKLVQEDMCERVFRAFGITKFMWLSPDDLERIATMIRQSGYFQNADLSIRKSELQNHVHVFLTVTPNSSYSYSLGENFKYFAAGNKASPRVWDTLSGEITNQKYSPVDTNRFGFNLWGTLANAAYVADPTILTSDDLQKFQAKNAYLADIYWKNGGTISRLISYDFELHAEDDNTYSDQRSRFNLVASADLLFHKNINIFRGSTYVGPSAIAATVTPYQVDTDGEGTSVFFPGLVFGYNYGREFSNNFNFLTSYYHAFGDQSIFTFDLNMQRNVDFLRSFFLLGIKERIVNDAVLPEDRFPLSAPSTVDDYIGLGKIFHGAQSDQRIGALLGSESLAYYSTANTSYGQNSPYLGLRYKWVGGAWNVNINLAYYFQRLY